ncbi:MAG: STAS domain-containing protein [Cytophagaceae bacterium]|nr:STAS domain-containing protein [Cytophagaceae bacterium]MDW8455807.1 STAS domain-containing protein [Cytophagaceae bacterium]
MNIQSVKEDLAYVISIDGELDASSSIHLDKAIEQAVSNNEKNILIDCTNLKYISSAGLGVFMSYLQDFENTGTSMILYNMSEKVKSVFSILGLDQLIQIVRNKEEAIKTISQ